MNIIDALAYSPLAFLAYGLVHALAHSKPEA